MQEEEMAELEREVPIEINPVKKWFDTNRTSLRNEATDIRARDMDKALILPFFEKEPDWSKFSAYQFKDGRKVYEIHLKNLSGIMPKEFFERFGSSGNDLIEESLLFVEKANGDLGYSVLVARYYSYGEKSEGMTYHKIPSHWSGRIDMFSYGERHLRSFEVEEGSLISHIRYEMKEESNKASNLGRSLMTHCIGYWIDFPYYGNGIYHVYSHQSIYVQHCWDMPTAPDGPSTDPNHDEGSPSGGGGSGAGSYGGVGPSPTYGIDDPLNYCNGPDCFPFPEEEIIRKIEEELIELNPCEKFVVLKYPLKAYQIYKNSIVANQKTQEIFGQYDGVNGRNDCADAFRHAYWNFLNTIYAGKQIAEEFATAHECDTPEHLSLEKDMDLHNNSVGRFLAGQSSFNTPEQIILEALQNGMLMVLSPLDLNNQIIPATQLISSNNTCF